MLCLNEMVFAVDGKQLMVALELLFPGIDRTLGNNMYLDSGL